jgi:hypothetical protein
MQSSNRRHRKDVLAPYASGVTATGSFGPSPNRSKEALVHVGI